MEQEKIGKFIAECRKQQKLTQVQLAEKLNITDRAISKWETGKGMPDSSIMIKLCDELQISVNELLKGERIPNNNVDVETDKNIINILNEYKRMKKRSNILKIFCITLLTLIITLIIGTFTINYFKNHIYKNVNLSETEENELYNKCLEYFINMQSPIVFAIENKDDKPIYDVSVSDFKVFAKLSKIGIIKRGKNIEVYAQITYKSYHVQNGELKSDSGGEPVIKVIFEGEKIVSYKDETIAVLMNKFLPTKELYNKYRKIDNTNLWKEIDKEVKEHYSYLPKKEDDMGIIRLETDYIEDSNIINDIINDVVIP